MQRRLNSGLGRPDYVLAVIVAALVVVGLIMVYSASFVLDLDNPTGYLVRQLTWLVVGLTVLVVLVRTDYQIWQRWSIPLLMTGLALLVVILARGGVRGGGQRWLLGGSIQPAELVKVIVIIYIADWLASKGDRIRQMSYGLLPFSILIGVVTSLIVLQPNMSTALLVTATCSLMFFVASADVLQLLISGVVGSGVIGLMVMLEPYRARRLTSFWNPLADSQNTGFQITQAIMALRSGGWIGVGLGRSQLKFAFPYLWHSDTIFAVIVEELGVLGALLVIGLYAALAWRGLRIARRAPDTFGSYLAVGITILITLQALINLAVVTAALPPTGVTLPFVSYGGSSLVTALIGVGLLLSVSRRARSGRSPTEPGNWTHAPTDFGWRDRRSRLPGPGSA
jgi:cell division protein FtsW